MYDETYVYEILQKNREQEWKKVSGNQVELKDKTYNRFICGIPFLTKISYCQGK